MFLVGLALALSCRSAKPVRTPRASASQFESEPLVRPPAQPARLTTRVHARYPHDPNAFTQGLVWDRGQLFESTGLIGESSLREVALQTGEVLRRVDNDSRVFAEGLALVGASLMQLTWHNERAMVFDRANFKQTHELRYRGEGWGLCHRGRELVMSDGTESLSFRDDQTFALKRKVRVTRDGAAQRMLNELECVDGKVYANVWQTDDIVRIDPGTGRVDAIIDAKNLLSDAERASADVLNGIAYMAERERFLLTGKRWPHLFEVSFEAQR
jgi:glutaminyl-peptide cyclotransferase